MIVEKRFVLVSDLHGEFLGKTELRQQLSKYLRQQRSEAGPHIDTVVIAGDVAPSFHGCLREILKEIRQMFSRVIYIPGNHEYYQVVGLGEFGVQDVEAQWSNLRRICQEEDVNLLDRGTVDLDSNNVLLGCTLWYKVDQSLQDKCMINDRFQIMGRGFSPELRFEQDSEWLDAALREVGSQNKKAIVVTHHLPLGKAHFDYVNRPPINYPYSFRQAAGFSTDLSPLMKTHWKTIRAWCFGHTHSQLSFRDPFTGCSFYSNPYGYPSENQNIKP